MAKPEKSALKSVPKRKKNKRAKAGQALGIAITLIVLVAVLSLTYFLLLVDSVVVVGNEQISTEDVLSIADIRPGVHMWLADVRGAINALKQIPYIKKADIQRIYPGTIRITITERVGRAVIIGMNSIALIDEDGYVLAIDSSANTEGLMRVVGMGSAGFQVSQRLGEETDFNSRALVMIIQALTRHDLAKSISRLDISNALSMYMTTVSGFNVQLGQPDNIDEKLEKLAIVLPELIARNITGGTINLSARGDPTYSPQQADNTGDVNIPGDANKTEDTGETGG
ncbi:MAG: FtsQ-type POTRA domain-containing protein [Clostridia bacterium]